MAQEPCIGLYKPCINLPFGDCAMYFDHGVIAYNLNLNKVAADSFFTWTVCTALEGHFSGDTKTNTRCV